jgi:hypothetical protein
MKLRYYKSILGKTNVKLRCACEAITYSFSEVALSNVADHGEIVALRLS